MALMTLGSANMAEHAKKSGKAGAKAGKAAAGSPAKTPTGANSFSREQLAMWRQRHRDTLKALGPEERQAHNKTSRKQVKDMAPDELAALKRELQAEWDALPAGRRQKFEAKFSG